MNARWAFLACLAAVWAAVIEASSPSMTFLGTYAGDAKAPARIAADAAGNTYATDPAAGAVVVYDTFGRVREKREGFARPLGIAVDALGRIYVAEEARGRVSVFDAQWTELFALGAGDGEFQMPNHIAVDPASSGHIVYVSDSKANQVKAYNEGALLYQFGSTGTNVAQFAFAAGVCVSTGGEVFVVDQGNDRVQVFDLTGGCRRVFTYMNKTNVWGRKQGVVADAAGRFYVANTLLAGAFRGAVCAHDATTGALLTSVGSPDAGDAPAGLAMDPLGRLYVASAGNGKILLYGVDSFVHLSCTPSANAVAVGTSLVFNATTGGAGPYAFQWLKDGNAMPDATNATLTVANAGVSDSGGYSVVIATASGTFTSSVAAVTVLWPPQIFSQPQDQVVLRGESAQFNVGASGSSLSFQWRFHGRDIPGATNSYLDVTGAEKADAGSYSVTVRNAVGSVDSAAASLTVIVPPLVAEIVSCGTVGDLFRLTVNGDPGYPYWLDASTNLFQWDPVFQLEANGIQDVDAGDAAGTPQRFYRLRWTP